MDIYMSKNFRIYSKIGLLLVIIGFFMPISCNQNGFQLAEYMVRMGDMKSEVTIAGILLYVLFISALLGLLIGVMLLTSKNINIEADWVLLLISIGSGIYVYFKMIKNIDILQSGAYVIATGWGISFLFLLISKKQ